MTPELEQLRRYVDALARRERALLASRAALGAVVTVAVGLVAAALAARFGAGRSGTWATLVLVWGVGAWLSAVPVLRGWRAASDRLRQARLAESREPGLGGRLVAAVHHLDGARGGESPGLLSLVARRAAAATAGLPAPLVHPSRPVRRLGGVAAFAWVAAFAALCLAPGGPLGLFGFLARSGAAEAAVDATVAVDGEAARVGDIVLRYVYPDHTGLEPVVVPNSTGDAHGPPGTTVEVLVRSAEPVRSAHLVAYEGEPVVAEVIDAREIRSSFVIGGEPGAWRLVLQGRDAPTSTRDFTITPEPDLPPDVQLLADEEEPISIPIDGSKILSWTARDDYGVQRVTWEVDGVERPLALRVPERATAALDGALELSAATLGVPPGVVVAVVVVAWDNDGVAGSKAGRSSPVRVVIGDEVIQDRREEERRAALLDALLTVLADHLEDPWPPGRTAGDLARWGETVAARYRPIEEIVDEFWPDMPSWSTDAELVDTVLASARELVRYTQVSFVPGSPEQPSSGAFLVTAELRDAAVVAVEDAIVVLDALRRADAWTDVSQSLSDASEAARRLEQALESPNVDPQDLLTQMEVLEALLQDIQRDAAQLEQSPLRELLNQRTSELQSLLEEARDALARGDLEEARELLSRLARAIEQMQQSVEDEIRRLDSEDSDAMGEARDLRQELADLEAEQREIQAETAAQRERTDGESARRAEELWRRADALATELSERAGRYEDGVSDAQRSFNERERAAALEAAVTQLRQAVTARDLEGAGAEAQSSREGIGGSRMSYEREARVRGGALPGPGRPELDEMDTGLTALERLLQQLRQAESQSAPNPAMSQLAERQRALEERLRAAEGQAREIGQSMPVPMRGLDEAMQGAGQQMGRARQSLERGQGMSAEGSEGMAAERLAEAQRALDDAMQRARQASSARRPGRPGGEQEGEGEGEGEGGQEPGRRGQDGDDRGPGETSDGRRVAIPSPEEFQTPEAYRQALLEGMEGDVPEEYRALKRRYFEELVSP
jgi:hypothetical protein